MKPDLYLTIFGTSEGFFTLDIQCKLCNRLQQTDCFFQHLMLCHTEEERSTFYEQWLRNELIPEGLPSQSAIEAKKIIHGSTCEKKPHQNGGYLHSEDDDRPYDVDGVMYCGRCHSYIKP